MKLRGKDRTRLPILIYGKRIFYLVEQAAKNHAQSTVLNIAICSSAASVQ